MTSQYTDADLARDVAEAGLGTAPRITAEMIESKIRGTHYHVFPGTTMTVCGVVLDNGFIVVGRSASASPANFDREIGRKLAFENARSQIWQLEGYLLRQRLHEEET